MLKKLWFWSKMTEQLDICLMRSLKAMFKQVIDTNQHDGAPGFYTPSFEWFSYETDLPGNSKPPRGYK